MKPVAPLRQGSLVLYKNRPARIIQTGQKKIQIRTKEGDELSVRPKDVILLHRGPVEHLSDLDNPEGDIETAWELLAGQGTNLHDLAELAFGEWTPSSAWQSWLAVNDGLYFSGEPDEISVHTRAEVTQLTAQRQAREAERLAWDAFLERLAKGAFLPEDQPYLDDVVALALGEHAGSRVMEALDKKASPENAHALLLECGYWDASINPYPARAGVPSSSPAPMPFTLPEEDRLDLTHLVCLAIDDAGNRDPDDAISIDGQKVWVHIADVAALVPPGSAADVVARSRGASLYLPEGTATMLPRAVTEMLGLGLEEKSPAFSIGFSLDAAGEIEDIEITPSWIKVQRLSYEEAEDQLDEEPLRSLLRIARQREAVRLANGAIEIELPEVKISVIDQQVQIKKLEALTSRNLVREMMLLAGKAVGSFALEHGIPIPFTSQEGPAEELQEASTPSEMFALRRRMKPSQQSLSPGSHTGLGMDLYVQATSPLRRYLDLVVHQQIRACLRGQAILDEQQIVQAIGATEAVNGNVRWAERRSNQHWTLVYLIQNPSWQGCGQVIDKFGQRSLLLVPDLALETSIYLKRDVPLDGRIELAFLDVNLPLLEAYFQEI